VALRVMGRAVDAQNIVPVDWVAKIIGGIVATPILHGRIYHLVHPAPPTNRQIKRAMEHHFRICGARFIPPERFPRRGLSSDERLFRHLSKPIEHYLIDSPSFDRANTADAERSLGLTCPVWDDAAIARLCRFASESNWGRELPEASNRDAFAEYFERFLPQRVRLSRIARAASIDARVRFVVGSNADDAWLCCFAQGDLVEVVRSGEGSSGDFGYRATERGFWRAVSGDVHPQELFLTGEAEIFGDAERALKMAMILNAFAREHPFDRQTWRQWRKSA
jgi:hypothetical protein